MIMNLICLGVGFIIGAICGSSKTGQMGVTEAWHVLGAKVGEWLNRREK